MTTASGPAAKNQAGGAKPVSAAKPTKPRKPPKIDPVTGKPKRGFRTFGRSGWAVAVIFAFLYAYHLWGGIANLVGVASSFSSFGVEVTGSVWALLIAYAVVPVVVYIAALVVGRTLSNGGRIIVFVVGFATVAVISQDLLSLA